MSSGVDTSKRRFLTVATTAVGGIGAAFVAVPFVKAFNPSERAKAIGAPVEVDISKLEPGMRIIVKWRGKPVWVMRRTEQALEAIRSLDSAVRDPDSQASIQPSYATNEYRSREPELLVLIGLCTHLGCSPTLVRADEPNALGPEWKGGFYCPCHGSRFDYAGRVYPGVPAPTNLEVPRYQLISDTRLVIGEDEKGAA